MFSEHDRCKNKAVADLVSCPTRARLPAWPEEVGEGHVHKTFNFIEVGQRKLAWRTIVINRSWSQPDPSLIPAWFRPDPWVKIRSFSVLNWLRNAIKDLSVTWCTKLVQSSREEKTADSQKNLIYTSAAQYLQDTGNDYWASDPRLSKHNNTTTFYKILSTYPFIP